jgi:Trimethylamine:corrinoid methyltransferase
MLFMLAAQNTGSNLLCGIGSCYNANGMSAEMMLIQSSWLAASRFLERGIATAGLDKGIESIVNTGHGGNFLIDDLTIELLRSEEFFEDPLFDFSGGYEKAPSMLEKAHEKVEEMVAGYKSPVPESIQSDLRQYFKRFY